MEIPVTKVSKLFYKKYPYKIAYKRLYGFPSQEVIEHRRSFNDGFNWWFDLPEDDTARRKRNNCYMFLKSFEDVKFNNGSFTHVYFLTKEDYTLARGRYRDLQFEAAEPFLDNLEEIITSHSATIDIKKKLYHGKYRYKIVFKFDAHFLDVVGPSLYELYKDNENYHLNPNIKRFAPGDHYRVTSYTTTHTHHGYPTTRWKFRHSYYNVYSIYCKERLDMEMAAFVASENISSITKAVLIDELDK